jgi:cytochrome P450
MQTLEDAPFLDIFAPGFQTDPMSFIESLRSQSQVVRTPIGGLVIGRAEVQALIADRRLRSSLLDLMRIQGVSEGPLFDSVSRSLLAVDGEDHTRLRKLVNRAFTPRAVDRHRGAMLDRLLPLVEQVRPRGRTEFMADVADHYPIQVMCDLLGVPAEDHEQFAQWNRSITWVLSFDLPAHREEAQQGMAGLHDYVLGLVTERRRHPKEDLVTELVQAEEEGDRLSDGELQTMIAGLLFAGYDTTRNQLGLAMWTFTDHPEQWALLADRPELAADAVEEIMRFRGAVGVAPRVVTEDIDVDGYHLPAGTLLLLDTAAANHDPSAYESPERLDIVAERQPQLTFGGGPHYCLGAALARAEMQEALPVLAKAMPHLALDGEPTWRPPLGIFGPESLPLRFG